MCWLRTLSLVEVNSHWSAESRTRPDDTGETSSLVSSWREMLRESSKTALLNVSGEGSKASLANDKFSLQSQCAVCPLAFVFDFLLLQGFASLVSKPSSALQHHLQECHSLQRCHNEGRSSCCQTCTCQTWLDRGKALGACLGSSFHSWQQGRQFRSGSGDKFDQTCNAQSCGIFSKCVLHLPFWTFYLNLEFSDSAQTTSSSSHLHDKKTIQ